MVAANVFSGCEGAPAIRAREGDPPSGGCNVFWDNADGNFNEYVPAPTDVEIDPRYCNAEGRDFTLRPDSPCLPGGIADCGQIGAFGEGCGVISVEKMSWSRIKSSFRSGE